MFKQERHEKLLQILTERQYATVDYLAKTLYISPSTIRRDLQQLAAQGYLKHQYGGAVLINDASRVPPIELRRQEMADTKQRIGKAALSLVNHGDVIFIDASSTCLSMVEGLKQFSNLTVFTNGQQVLEALSATGIESYSTGGRLLRNSMAFTGRFAEEFLERVNIKKYFFSFQGLAKDGTFSDGGELENRIHHVVLRQPGMKIALCDKSKFGASFTYKTGELEQLDYLVCDFPLFQLAPELDPESVHLIQV